MAEQIFNIEVGDWVRQMRGRTYADTLAEPAASRGVAQRRFTRTLQILQSVDVAHQTSMQNYQRLESSQK